MLTIEQFEDRRSKALGGNRYAAADAFSFLERSPPGALHALHESEREWASDYLLMYIAMHGPYCCRGATYGDARQAQEHAMLTYDSLVDKGIFDHLGEAEIYADELRRMGDIVTWEEERLGTGGGSSVYVDIPERAPSLAKMVSDVPAFPVAFLEEVRAVVRTPVGFVATGVLVLGVGYLLLNIFSPRKKKG